MAGSPTRVRSPELLATKTMRMSRGTKSNPSSAAMGGKRGANKITVVALGSTAQMGVVIPTIARRRRFPSPLAKITIWVAK